LIQAEKLAAMGQMLAGVAHELNNPLTAILGVTELLRERQGADETMQRQLELTHRQARRAARIVQNLLEFSRPASPQKKPLDVNVLVERTLQLHEHSLRRNQIKVEFEAQRGSPQVLGDGNQLIQVLLNLVTNAEQAIREVRESGHIRIRLGVHGGRIAIGVQDDGVGILPEALPRIFDPFYTTKRPGSPRVVRSLRSIFRDCRSSPVRWKAARSPVQRVLVRPLQKPTRTRFAIVRCW
jgi:two-component system, NtrC family, sensor kinase